LLGPVKNLISFGVFMVILVFQVKCVEFCFEDFIFGLALSCLGVGFRM
jgi:hypothetical protein